MRKCYIEERGVKYEEVSGSQLLCTERNSEFFPKIETIEKYDKAYPYILKSEEKEKPQQLREIEGKLYYLKRADRLVGNCMEVVPEFVYKRGTNKIIGQWNRHVSEKHICYWIPLTLDMLHKDNNDD